MGCGPGACPGDFNPRSPCGERLPSGGIFRGIFPISIHAPLAGSDIWVSIGIHKFGYFNPRSPCGERQGLWECFRLSRYFNPRSPCGERLHIKRHINIPVDFNPRSPCGERPLLVKNYLRGISISIHAPLAGSDFGMPTTVPTTTDFNPRSPCGERLRPSQNALIESKFQSTLPLRGAT